MEVTGKVIRILEPQRFVSKKNGNEYIRHTFVIETQGQYPKRVVFNVIGDDRFNQMGIRQDANYSVSFDIDSREWNGKWFVELTAWKAVCLDGAQQPAPQQSEHNDAPF